MAYSPQAIEQVSAAVRTVKDIDHAIKALAGMNLTKRSELGDEVRSKIGRNVFSQFSNDQVGTIVSSALQAALIQRREVLVNDYKEIVNMPSPPQVSPVAAKDPPYDEFDIDGGR